MIQMTNFFNQKKIYKYFVLIHEEISIQKSIMYKFQNHNTYKLKFFMNFVHLIFKKYINYMLLFWQVLIKSLCL